MRKIVIGGVAAALALGLTACGGNGDGSSAAAPASSPSSPAGSTPSSAPTPSAPSTPGGTSAPRGTGGTRAPVVRHTPLAQPGGQQIKSQWGRLQYLAPGKYIVGDIGFFTATDTVLYVAGGTCPDGSTPPDDSKCSVDGLDEWAQAAPHNVNVRFSGQVATVITETQ
jgi:hypothetical protein